jgi:phenylacetate-CoA ligase
MTTTSSTTPALTVATPLPDGGRPEPLPARGPDRLPVAGGHPGRGAAPGPAADRPALVATSSEVQTADLRRRMGEAWGVEPLDFHDTSEALMVAAIVEVVDDHDRPVPPGMPGARVLLTNLVNRVQPLLR